MDPEYLKMASKPTGIAMPDETTPILEGGPEEPEGLTKLFLKYVRPSMAECTAVFIFVYIGVMSSSNLLLGEQMGVVALAHGLTIVLLVASFGHVGGGHVNPAVTLGAVIAGACDWTVGLCYLVFQLLGSILGAIFALISTSFITDTGRTLWVEMGGGVPQLASNVGTGTGVLIESILTFILVLTVLMTAVDRASQVAPIAIGFAVAAGIMAAGKLTGAAMNPARSFGPALVAVNWTDEWVYWVGPLIGAIVAGLLYRTILGGPSKRLVYKSKGE